MKASDIIRELNKLGGKHGIGIVDIVESGSTLRFMIPIAMLSKNTIVFGGASSLMKRPMGVYAELAEEKGMEFWLYNEGGFPSGMVCGKIRNMRPHLAKKNIGYREFLLPEFPGRSGRFGAHTDPKST